MSAQIPITKEPVGLLRNDGKPTDSQALSKCERTNCGTIRLLMGRTNSLDDKHNGSPLNSWVHLQQLRS